MKKIFSIVLALGCLVTANAVAPSYSAVDAVYEWFFVDGYDPVTIADDTIANNAADTVTVISDLNIRGLEQGYEYILQKKATTGGDGTAGEINLELFAVVKDSEGNTVQTVAIDTVAGVTSTVGESILLPFGGSVFGMKVDLKYRTLQTSGNDTAILVGDHYLIKRRPVMYMKR